MQNMSNVMQPILVSVQDANHLGGKYDATMDQNAKKLVWDNM